MSVRVLDPNLAQDLQQMSDAELLTIIENTRAGSKVSRLAAQELAKRSRAMLDRIERGAVAKKYTVKSEPKKPQVRHGKKGGKGKSPKSSQKKSQDKEVKPGRNPLIRIFRTKSSKGRIIITASNKIETKEG